MTSNASHTAKNPVAKKPTQAPPIRLGLARYLACRELSLLVREEEDLCPTPSHPTVLLEETNRKQSDSQAEARLSKQNSQESETTMALSCPLRRLNTGLSLTDNESDSETNSESGSYKSLPLCLEESCESSQHSAENEPKERSMTLSTEESRVVQRSRLGSIDAIVAQEFQTKSEEEILQARERNLARKALELEAKYSRGLAQICSQIPMSDSAYGYAVSLFKSVVLRIDAATSCSDPAGLAPEAKALLAKLSSNPSLFRDSEKLFKVCVYEGYKVIEDEYALYLEDFAKVAGLAKDELAELETFVVCDVMSFRMLRLYAFDEQVSEEVQLLKRLAAD